MNVNADPYRTAAEISERAAALGDRQTQNVIDNAILKGATSSEILGDLGLAAQGLLTRPALDPDLRALVVRLASEVGGAWRP